MHVEVLSSAPECGKDREDRLMHTASLQPSDSLEAPVDRFPHTTHPQFPPQPPGGPTEPIEVGLAHNLLPLQAFAPGAGM